MLPGEVLPRSYERSRYVDGTLPFDESHHLRNRPIRRNRQQHVHMIDHQVPLQHFGLQTTR